MLETSTDTTTSATVTSNWTLEEAPTAVTQDPAVNMYAAVAIFWVISFSGVICNCLFCATYFYSKTLRASAFFSLAASLAVADTLQLCLAAFYGTVSSYLGYNVGGTFGSAMIAALSNLAWFCINPTLLMQAINRLIAIRFPTKMITVYTVRNTRIAMILPWCISVIITIPNFFPCCYQLWYWELYSYGYNLPVFGSVVYSYFDASFTMSIMVVVFIIHSVIFIRLIRRKKTIGNSSLVNGGNSAQIERKRRQETALFVQFFIMTTLPVITSIISNIVPLLEVNSTMSSAVVNAILLMYSAANGWIYLFFNRTVKEEFRVVVKRILKRFGVTSVFTVGSGSATFGLSNLRPSHNISTHHMPTNSVVTK